MAVEVRFKVGPIDHVEMFVPDRVKAAQWYSDFLGLRSVPDTEFWAEDPDGPLMISSDGGGTKLALFRGDPPGNQSVTGFLRVAFRVSGSEFLDLLESLDDVELVDHQNRRLSKDMVVDHERSFSIYFSDPYGHRLEITTYDYELVAASLRNG